MNKEVNRNDNNTVWVALKMCLEFIQDENEKNTKAPQSVSSKPGMFPLNLGCAL